MKSYVDFINDFADALCLDKFHIAGNSMGCMNTVYYVVAHPERVAELHPDRRRRRRRRPRGTDARRKGQFPTVTAYDGTREGMRAMMDGIIYRGEAINDELVDMRYPPPATGWKPMRSSGRPCCSTGGSPTGPTRTARRG